MIGSNSAEKTSERIFEESLYEQVANELSQGEKRAGLCKALTDTDFSEDKAKAMYIKYRVQSIKDELDLLDSEEKKQKEVKKTRMALVKCKECGEEASTKAKTCPKCGAKAPKKTSVFTWLVLALWLFLALAIMTNSGV